MLNFKADSRVLEIKHQTKQKNKKTSLELNLIHSTKIKSLQKTL